MHALTNTNFVMHPKNGLLITCLTRGNTEKFFRGGGGGGEC